MANNFDLMIKWLNGSEIEVQAGDATALSGSEKVLVIQNGSPQETTTQAIANLGGGGTATLQATMISYKNSAMSAAVYAYVFKDHDGNITRVYEPLRNNDVSRQVFAYADSIDKFPFDADADDVYNNYLIDVKFDGFNATYFYNNTLSAMIINCNGFTGLTFYDNIWKGNYGRDFSGNIEINISGNDVVFIRNFGLPYAYVNGISEANIYSDNTFLAGVSIDYNGFTATTANIKSNLFSPNSGFELIADAITAGLPLSIVGNHFSKSAYLDIGAPKTFNQNFLETNVFITVLHDVIESKFGISVQYNTAGNISGKKFEKFAATMYEIGLTGSNVTATAV